MAICRLQTKSIYHHYHQDQLYHHDHQDVSAVRLQLDDWQTKFDIETLGEEDLEEVEVDEVPFSSTFSAAAGATELLRGWKVAQKLALLALSDVGERGIGSRGHALAVGPSHCDYSL